VANLSAVKVSGQLQLFNTVGTRGGALAERMSAESFEANLAKIKAYAEPVLGATMARLAQLEDLEWRETNAGKRWMANLAASASKGGRTARAGTRTTDGDTTLNAHKLEVL